MAPFSLWLSIHACTHRYTHTHLITSNQEKKNKLSTAASLQPVQLDRQYQSFTVGPLPAASKQRVLSQHGVKPEYNQLPSYNRRAPWQPLCSFCSFIDSIVAQHNLNVYEKDREGGKYANIPTNNVCKMFYFKSVYTELEQWLDGRSSPRFFLLVKLIETDDLLSFLTLCENTVYLLFFPPPSFL